MAEIYKESQLGLLDPRTVFLLDQISYLDCMFRTEAEKLFLYRDDDLTPSPDWLVMRAENP